LKHYERKFSGRWHRHRESLIAAARSVKPDRRGGCLSITACDTDADAIQIAKENADLNEVTARIDFRAGTVDDDTASADLVCANLASPVIVSYCRSSSAQPADA
jgi:23S rRNA G2445 N2-methylase RlmL